MSFVRSEGRRAPNAATSSGPSSVEATMLFAERTTEPPFVYPDEPPHASFESPEAPANVPSRESIEFRTMAFF